ncbi:hypothetical protein ZWY2020_045957 [Hordeum vulgare]|nr:hypothetical protein ZWY2020_045957 [Hordeum vulgare]
MLELTAATRPVLHHRRRLASPRPLQRWGPSRRPRVLVAHGVFLNGNRLPGNFPAPLLTQPGLLHLSFGGNGLSGAIPPALANLTRLRTLLLEENRFAGEIPDLPPVLLEFNVSFNRLTDPSRLAPLQATGVPRMSALPGEAPPSPAPTGRRLVDNTGDLTSPMAETTNKPTRREQAPATPLPDRHSLRQARASPVPHPPLPVGRTKTRALEMPTPSPSPAVIPGGRKPPELPSV